MTNQDVCLCFSCFFVNLLTPTPSLCHSQSFFLAYSIDSVGLKTRLFIILVRNKHMFFAVVATSSDNACLPRHYVDYWFELVSQFQLITCVALLSCFEVMEFILSHFFLSFCTAKLISAWIKTLDNDVTVKLHISIILVNSNIINGLSCLLDYVTLKILYVRFMIYVYSFSLAEMVEPQITD